MPSPLIIDFPETRPAVLVHGGAWAIPASLREAHAEGCREAASAGMAALAAGADGVTAAVAAVNVLERDPTFDAGRGSFLNRDGVVEMDAAVMRGSDLAFGGVAGIRRFESAVRIAARVMSEVDVAILVGEGAERFADEAGEPMIDPESLVVKRERARWEETLATGPGALAATFGDTVGVVVVDDAGAVVAAGSTGGTPFKRVGRVGDTPLPGCGLYADDRTGAVAATGHGESILRLALCQRVMTALERGDIAPGGAIADALAYLRERVDGRGGLIATTVDGRLALGHTSLAMAYGYCARTADPLGAVSVLD